MPDDGKIADIRGGMRRHASNDEAFRRLAQAFRVNPWRNRAIRTRSEHTGGAVWRCEVGRDREGRAYLDASVIEKNVCQEKERSDEMATAKKARKWPR
jgi:hypothetical protein